MHKLLVVYTTYDGHSAKIAKRIAAVQEGSDCAVELCDIARTIPQHPTKEYEGVVISGPLQGGKHAPKLTQFVSTNLATWNELPSAFFSVSLSAAGGPGQQDDATRCLSDFLDETGWHPDSTSTIAGALLYREYGFFKRWMMKMIVKRAGGDTDTSRNYVYTDWDAVDHFALEFLDEVRAKTLFAETSAGTRIPEVLSD